VSNPFDPGYFSSLELRAFPFARVGENSAIARNCTIIGLENIKIGDNVRIDGFTTIIASSGSLSIGSHVHIGIGCVLGARGGVTIGDYSSLSSGVRILSAIDDFGGRHMAGSTLPDDVLGVHAAPVRVGKHVPIGAGALILPGVEIGEGAAVGAMSMVNRPLRSWVIHSGNPVREVGPRAQDVLALEGRVAQRAGTV
jgi:galactoside O-acetyltransferase